MTASDTLPTFAPYAWQDAEWQAFQRLLDSGKLPHALLLSGPAEIGKQHFAMAMVARMLCQAPLESMACRKCKNCLLVCSGSHPDFLKVQPDKTGGSISVDSIRQLSDFVAKTAMYGGWRVVLVEPAESMTHNAANALLKTLEEPGKGSLLLLVHHQEGELLPTIRSRCQLWSFPLPSPALSINWLQENCSADICPELLETAGQRPLRALRIAGDDSLEQIKNMQAVLADVAAGVLSPVDGAERCKLVPPADLVEWMLAAQRKIILSAARDNRVPGRGCFLFLDQLNFIRAQLASKTRPNSQLLIEELLFGWQRMQNLF